MNSRNLESQIAASLVEKYGIERAEIVATNKAMGAMTDEKADYWFLVAGEISEMKGAQ